MQNLLCVTSAAAGKCLEHFITFSGTAWLQRQMSAALLLLCMCPRFGRRILVRSIVFQWFSSFEGNYICQLAHLFGCPMQDHTTEFNWMRNSYLQPRIVTAWPHYIVPHSVATWPFVRSTLMSLNGDVFRKFGLNGDSYEFGHGTEDCPT